MIVEAFGGVPDNNRVKFWENIAVKLSRIVGKSKPWDWRYPAQVFTGQTKPSPKFAAAVMALGAALDEVPVSMAYTIQVSVFAKPGTVDPGALILGESKACARPGCKVLIVPNVPWRKYCSDECRRKATEEILEHL